MLFVDEFFEEFGNFIGVLVLVMIVDVSVMVVGSLYRWFLFGFGGISDDILFECWDELVVKILWLFFS